MALANDERGCRLFANLGAMCGVRCGEEGSIMGRDGRYLEFSNFKTTSIENFYFKNVECGQRVDVQWCSNYEQPYIHPPNKVTF